MIGAQLLNAARFVHCRDPVSKNPGSFSNCSSWGRERGGASSAARKAFHCDALRAKTRRSARVSSMRDKALSNTNSLTDRCATAATAFRVRFALRVKRKSSFSVRVVCDAINIFIFKSRHNARQCETKRSSSLSDDVSSAPHQFRGGAAMSYNSEKSLAGLTSGGGREQFATCLRSPKREREAGSKLDAQEMPPTESWGTASSV